MDVIESVDRIEFDQVKPPPFPDRGMGGIQQRKQVLGVIDAAVTSLVDITTTGHLDGEPLDPVDKAVTVITMYVATRQMIDALTSDPAIPFDVKEQLAASKQKIVDVAKGTLFVLTRCTYHAYHTIGELRDLLAAYAPLPPGTVAEKSDNDI